MDFPGRSLKPPGFNQESPCIFNQNNQEAHLCSKSIPASPAGPASAMGKGTREHGACGTGVEQMGKRHGNMVVQALSAPRSQRIKVLWPWIKTQIVPPLKWVLTWVVISPYPKMVPLVLNHGHIRVVQGLQSGFHNGPIKNALVESEPR